MITYLLNNEILSEDDLRQEAEGDMTNSQTAPIDEVISVVESMYDTTIVVQENE